MDKTCTESTIEMVIIVLPTQSTKPHGSSTQISWYIHRLRRGFWLYLGCGFSYLSFELLQYTQSYLKLLPTTTKSRNFLFSQAYIFSFRTWTAEKGALGNDPYLLHWQILSGNIITEANRCGIPLLCCFTHKILLRRLHQLTYKHLMQRDRTIPPHWWMDGPIYGACIVSTYSTGCTGNQKIR